MTHHGGAMNCRQNGSVVSIRVFCWMRPLQNTTDAHAISWMGQNSIQMQFCSHFMVLVPSCRDDVGSIHDLLFENRLVVSVGIPFPVVEADPLDSRFRHLHVFCCAMDQSSVSLHSRTACTSLLHWSEGISSVKSSVSSQSCVCRSQTGGPR